MKNTAARYLVTVGASGALILGIGFAANAMSGTNSPDGTAIGTQVSVPSASSKDDTSATPEPSTEPSESAEPSAEPTVEPSEAPKTTNDTPSQTNLSGGGSASLGSLGGIAGDDDADEVGEDNHSGDSEQGSTDEHHSSGSEDSGHDD